MATAINSFISNPKCLIIDDNIAQNFHKRKEFLDLMGLPTKCAIFIDNYEEAFNFIQSRSDIAFCFLDCRIPKTNYESYDYESDSTNCDSEWGLKLIPYFQASTLLFVFSTFVSESYLKQEVESYTNIVGCSGKPFPDSLAIELKKKYLEKIFMIEIEEPISLKFDYASLDNEISFFVQKNTKKIKSLTERKAQDIIKIGTYLIEIKDKLGHGNFYKWLESEEFSWGENTAYNFMRVAQKFQSLNLENLDILPTVLYELSFVSSPKEVVKEVVERAKQGETISDRTVKAIKLRHSLKKQKIGKNAQQETLTKNEPTIILFEEKKQISQNNEEILLTNFSSKDASSPAKFTDESESEILSVRHNVIKNSYWQLGKHHRLFCGKSTNNLFLKQIPNNIALTLNFPPNNDISLIPSIDSQSNFLLSHQYDEINLKYVKKMVKNTILGLTAPKDNVVFSYIFDPALLNLAVKLGCYCYIAEPDLQKCERILADWRQKSSFSQLNL